MPSSTTVVACTPRTGSSLLCRGLRAYGLGNFNEWFRGEGVRSQELQLARARLGTDSEGVFGCKVHWHQMTRLLRWAVAIEDVFPSAGWIHLYRRDTAAQAMSLLRAEATGYWFAQSPESPPDVDLSELAYVDRVLQFHDHCWTAWFASRGIDPYRIAYEDLAVNPQATTGGVAHILGHRRLEEMPDLPIRQPHDDARDAEFLESYRLTQPEPQAPKGWTLSGPSFWRTAA